MFGAMPDMIRPWRTVALSLGAATLFAGCGNSNAPTGASQGGTSRPASRAAETTASASATTASAITASATAPDAAKGIVWLGVTGPYTGASADLGIMLKLGAELAQKHVNEAGGVNGAKLELRIEDDEGKAATAATVANNLASDSRILAVLGHFNSSCSNSGKPAYTAQKLVMLSPASTAVNVTQDSDYVFRNIFTDDFQGRSLAVYAGKVLGFKKVAILFDNDDYGTGLKESFRNRAKGLGVEVVNETAYNRENPDFRSQLASIEASKPEALVVAGLYGEAATIAKQARESGITVPILGGDGVFSDGYVSLAGEASDGSMVTCPFLFDAADTRASKFKADFEALHNRAPDGWAAQGYDAVMIVVDAMRKNGASRDAIHKSLKAINTTATAYDGITGPTYFDANGDTRKPVIVATVRGGKWVKAEKQLTAEDSELAAK